MSDRPFGGQTHVAPLRRVLVRSPETVDLGLWRAFGWLAEPDAALAAKQHDALCEILRAAGAEASQLTIETITRYVSNAMACFQNATPALEDAFLDALRDGALQAHDTVRSSAAKQPAPKKGK